jgi:toluene monooxygenase system protein E
MPGDYDIGTSRLLYYPQRGFEVKTPIAAWHERHGQHSPLVIPDPEAFRDPRETSYSKYTELQDRKETFVDELFKSIDASRSDAKLDPAWLKLLESMMPPARFPLHGLHMIAAYLGHLAPSGRLAVVCLFQAADEMRRVQRFAYRMCQIQLTAAGFGADSRDQWQTDPMWQPLRFAVEKLLVTYDWGEALVALNLCLKPRLDHLLLTSLAEVARASGDASFAELAYSLDEDCEWHRAWSAELVRLAIASRHENAATIEGWLARWDPIATVAVSAFAPAFDAAPVAASFAGRMAALESRLVEERRAFGLRGGRA